MDINPENNTTAFLGLRLFRVIRIYILPHAFNLFLDSGLLVHIFTGYAV